MTLNSMALAAAVGMWLALPAAAPAGDDLAGYHGSERAENRVGRSFWARPGLSDTSVDFYKEPELRSRAPIYRKARFKVLDVVATRPFPAPELVYLVKFDAGDQAYIGVEQFDQQLFREPRPNQVVTTTFDPPLGEAVHVYLFKRSAIFNADPDVIWQRIKDDGPRSLRRATPVEPPPAPKPAPTPR